MQKPVTVGYHNGGLGLADRSLVESLFLKRDLQVLCTTNTLAHGVNLPAHTVVIKSTQYFSKEKGGYVEYDRGSILQMCGRAGRPQFDDSGVAIIMTRRETVHLYENLLSGCEPVESELFASIAEHLNAEIVLMTVSDVSLAIDWLKCSFLYVRIKKNPEHYKIHHGGSAEQLEKKLKDICLQNVSQLSTYGLIQTDEDGYILRPLEPGRLMAKYYLCFETMKLIVQSTSGSTMEDLLHILTQAQELKWIKLRRTEKKLLNDINSDIPGRLRFHVVSPNGKVKKRIQTAEEKIFILTNDAMSGEPSPLDFTMSQDVNGICSNGKRIARCMSDYFIFKKRFLESINALTLAKCLHQRLWEDSPYQLKQLAGVGMVTAKALLHAGINSFASLLSADPRRLESLTGRKYPFGNHVKESLDSLPPNVSMKFLDESRSKQGMPYILQLTRSCQQTQYKKKHFADLVVGTESDNKLLFHEKIRLEQFSSPYQITVRSASTTHSGDVFATLISEEYVGVDVTARFTNSSGEKESPSWKKRSFDCARQRELTEKQGSDSVSTPLSTENLVPQEESLRAESPKAAWPARAFSGPTFNLLPDTHQQPRKKVDCLGNGISEQDDPRAESRESNAKKRVMVTKLNVFDHIKKKARKLPGLSGVSRVDTPANSVPIKTSVAFGTPERAQKDQLGQLQDCAQEKMANNVDTLFWKEEPQSIFEAITCGRALCQSPNDAPLKNSFPPVSKILKQSSPVSAPSSCGREDSKPSFMGCTSIFSFLTGGGRWSACSGWTMDDVRSLNAFANMRKIWQVRWLSMIPISITD
ncbi:hypothetical protein L7F22_029463 [Adiantum nelumboides]|nr:hypothetical protein [Adiantum nelumboides]